MTQTPVPTCHQSQSLSSCLPQDLLLQTLTLSTAPLPFTVAYPLGSSSGSSLTLAWGTEQMVTLASIWPCSSGGGGSSSDPRPGFSSGSGSGSSTGARVRSITSETAAVQLGRGWSNHVLCSPGQERVQSGAGLANGK